MPSRGNAISAYLPPFAKGAKVYGDNINSATITRANLGANIVNSAKVAGRFLSGTISGLLSGVVAVSHTLGIKPKFIIVSTIAAHADVVAGRYAFLAAASAATSANFYIKATKSGNVKYAAYLQL